MAPEGSGGQAHRDMDLGFKRGPFPTKLGVLYNFLYFSNAYFAVNLLNPNEMIFRPITIAMYLEGKSTNKRKTAHLFRL